MDPSDFRNKISDPSGASQLGFNAGFSDFSQNEKIADNPLRQIFDAREKGAGIWKWAHYFDVYDKHFSRFRGQEVHVLEIGIYSGGSLEMWREYFGPKAHIYGVDINPSCKAYERDGVKVFIGNQSDADFWSEFRKEVPRIDIVIDDGSHEAWYQAISIENLLPHVSRGGVYFVEDLVGGDQQANAGASYIHGLAHKLNGRTGTVRENNTTRWSVATPNAFQRAVASVHLYPFIAVIERNDTDVTELVSARQGTEWEPPTFWQEAIAAKQNWLK